LYEVKFLVNALTILVGLLFLYYLVNKYSGFPVRGVKGRRRIEVLERYPLTGDSGLILFRFDKKVFLAFYGKENFKVISETEDVEESSFSFPDSSDSSSRNSK
jgi:hypothetical protein